MLLPIDQHIHGAFGVNFSDCSVSDLLDTSKKLKTAGIGGFFPTLVTDSVDNIKRQIEIIKEASQKQTQDMAKIYGIHLEGIFINPEKKGIHNEDLFLEPTIKNYKLIEDDFIKIVTLAPELDKNSELTEYLKSKGIKVQAGHCIGSDLSKCDGVTHLFNAMLGLNNHRGKSTVLSALNDDNLYTEIIADGTHLSDDILKLIFKIKPINKILLISDSLPCAGLKASECNSFEFAGKTIYYDGKKAVSKNGTLAGSTSLLPKIIERLKKLGLYSQQLIENTYKYHKIRF